MNFLNIGTMEMMVIIAIAILVIGPKRMVQVARTIGRMATRMRQISGEFTSILRSEFAELDEARQEVQGALSQIAGTQAGPPAEGEASSVAEALKADADESIKPIVQDGLGLAAIASELRATAVEAQQFVRKASREAEDTSDQSPVSGGDGDQRPVFVEDQVTEAAAVDEQPAVSIPQSTNEVDTASCEQSGIAGDAITAANAPAEDGNCRPLEAFDPGDVTAPADASAPDVNVSAAHVDGQPLAFEEPVTGCEMAVAETSTDAPETPAAEAKGCLEEERASPSTNTEQASSECDDDGEAPKAPPPDSEAASVVPSDQADSGTARRFMTESAAAPPLDPDLGQEDA